MDKSDAPQKAKKSIGREGKKSEKKAKGKLAPPAGSGAGWLGNVPLDEIDLDDTTFCFRVELGHAGLEKLGESLKKNGQHVPVILREREGKKAQIVSGFRRVEAAQDVGWPDILAHVRDDLDDDDRAFRASIEENEGREDYTALDRAHAVLKYRSMGRTNAQIGDLFRLSTRQVQRLRRLTELPAELREAMQGGRVSETSALLLAQCAEKSGEDAAALLAWAEEERPSVRDLRERLRASETRKEPGEDGFRLFRERDADGRKSFELRRVVIRDSLPDDDKKALVEELRKLMSFLQGG